MKRLPFLAAIMAVLLMTGSACKKESKLTVPFSDKFEGKHAVLLNYMDSTALDSVEIIKGVATFENLPLKDNPVFVAVTVDGRIRNYYVMEPGTAEVKDSTGNVYGTPLNDRLSKILLQLDSVDNLDDLNKYVEYVEARYNENKDNVIGDYLGVEWLKFADPTRVDSLLTLTPPEFRDSKRARYYTEVAHKRAATAPGQKYTDFYGEDRNGKRQRFSALVGEGKYTIIDFWASWCPYCIKELPALASLYDEYGKRGLEIVGVAVRDNSDDTRAMVRNKEIKWPVLYNTQRVPYDIYGFAGIPHHILLSPDGTIISRGENVEQLRSRLETLLK